MLLATDLRFLPVSLAILSALLGEMHGTLLSLTIGAYCLPIPCLMELKSFFLKFFAVRNELIALSHSFLHIFVFFSHPFVPPLFSCALEVSPREKGFSESLANTSLFLVTSSCFCLKCQTSTNSSHFPFSHRFFISQSAWFSQSIHWETYTGNFAKQKSNSLFPMNKATKA